VLYKELDNNSDEVITFTVDKESAGQRIDRFLAFQIKNQSRSHIQKVIDNKYACVNGKIVAKNFELSTSDVVAIRNFGHLEMAKKQIKPQDISLNVI